MRISICVLLAATFLCFAVCASEPLPVDTSLEDAVEQFNEEAQSDPIGRTQPLRTVDEVVTAIRKWGRKREPLMNDAHFVAFQKIAETRVLPAGSHLDWITFWGDRDGNGLNIWWVDLFLHQNPAAPDP